MHRRLLGGLVLAAATVLMLLASAVLRVGVPGTATAEFSAVPRPGACTVALGSDVLVVTPCTSAHTGEVEKLLTPGPASLDPPATGTTSTTGVNGTALSPYGSSVDLAPRSNCLAALPQYFRTAAAAIAAEGDSGWIPATTDYSVSVVPGPAGAGAGYPACLISPILPADNPRYTGRIAGLTSAGRTTGLHQCFAESDSTQLTGCTQHHAGELLAARVLPVAGHNDADTEAAVILPEWREQCRQLAGSLIGTGDPTFAGRTAVQAAVETIKGQGADGTSRTSIRVTCSLWVAPDVPLALVGSVFDLRARTCP